MPFTTESETAKNTRLGKRNDYTKRKQHFLSNSKFYVFYDRVENGKKHKAWKK
jgi:hypothetical protein